MPDITMCASDECPKCTECYRHECKPSEWRQAYAEFYKVGEECIHFIPLEQTK